LLSIFTSQIQPDIQLFDRNECFLNPELYLSVGGCLKWDWNRFESQFLEDWSENSHAFGRVTVNSLVSSAECFLYQQFIVQHRNIHHDSGIVRYVSQFFHNSVFYPHPNDDATTISHLEVTKANLEIRYRKNVVSLSLCFAGGWDKFMSHSIVPITHTTNTKEHNDTRMLNEMMFPAVSTNTSIPQGVYTIGLDLDTNEVQDLKDSLAVAIVSALFLFPPPYPHPKFEKSVKDFMPFAYYWFHSEDYHRLFGHMLSTAYLHQRNSWLNVILNITDVNPLLAKIKTRGLDFNVENIIEILAGLVNVPPVVSLAYNMLRFIQRNPCELIPLWNQNPEKFVLEYGRLHPTVSGFLASDSPSNPLRFYSVASGNLDPLVFPNPYLFDVNRNLDAVLNFNTLGLDGSPTASLRPCIGRYFVVNSLVAILPDFFIKNETCSKEGKVRKFYGVDLIKESLVCSLIITIIFL
jgi:hypothetical protein